jgi:hypothetical protein
VCDGKSFYDAVIDRDYAREMKSQRSDGRMLPVGAGDMAAICTECAKTHEIVVRLRTTF